MNSMEKTAVIKNYLTKSNSPIYENIQDIADKIIKNICCEETKQMQVMLREDGTFTKIKEYLYNGLKTFTDIILSIKVKINLEDIYNNVVEYASIDLNTYDIINDNKKIIFLEMDNTSTDIASVYIKNYAIINHIFMVVFERPQENLCKSE